MKRSTLPNRAAPLASGGPLRRGKPLRRTTFPNRSTAITQKVATTTAKAAKGDKGKAAAQKAVRLRPGPGSPCEVRSPWCQGRGNQFSHRWHKGQGGPWTASNGLRVCGLGNAAGCHGWIHQNPIDAEKKGWIVLPGPGGKVDTTKVSALIHTVNYGHARVFLDNKGGVTLDTERGVAA